MKKTAILISLAALTACTDFPAPTTNLAPATGTAGVTIGGAVLASAHDGTAFDVTIDGTAYTVTRDSSLDHGVFRAGKNTSGAGFLVLALDGKTSNGAMTASVAAQSIGGSQSQGAAFSRINNTAMPTVGSANFSGQYVGNIQFGRTFMVTGNADLSADFGASTISGSISDRKMLFANGSLYSHMQNATLDTTAIDGTGAFSGTVTGGAVSSFGSTTDVSSGYSGLIGGSTGNQVAGAVQIDKVYTGISGVHGIEIGVFLGE